MRAAIYFEPDAFVLEGRQVMGRRSAGAAFLRAAVLGRGTEPVSAYVTNVAARSAFLDAVRRIERDAPTRCIGAGSLDQLAQCGTLYRPDPMIAFDARLRLRRGATAYSICGVTHTISSAGLLEAFGRMASEPLMEWDALICTSTVARQVVGETMDEAWDQLGWLTGAGRRRAPPQLPVIPLGVHCNDWKSSDQGRATARAAFGLSDNEVVLLFAGRLSYAGKAHPFQMFEALRTVAERSRRPLVLLMAGQYSLEPVQRAFEEAVQAVCPGLRFIHVDGAGDQAYAMAFAGADIFISLADSHQETFGITPVEAMASGLPVIVSDWNGYRDTVRDGVDGFRIPSWAPAPAMGVELAKFYESTGGFEHASARASGAVSLDLQSLVESLARLVEDADLRRSMGAAGQRHAAAAFDWAVVYARYVELWQELGDIRRVRGDDPGTRTFLGAAPRAHFSWPDPFERFACFASRHIGPATVVRRMLQPDLRYPDVAALAVFAQLRFSDEIAEAILAQTDCDGATVAQIAATLRLDIPLAVELVGRLAKMDLVTLE